MVVAALGPVDVGPGTGVEDAEPAAVAFEPLKWEELAGMLELAYVVAVEEADVTVKVEDTVERGIKTLLELGLELAAPLPEGELTARVGLRGIVAMMLGMGSMAKMLDELLQQARLPGPLPSVSQQLDKAVSYTKSYISCLWG